MKTGKLCVAVAALAISAAVSVDAMATPVDVGSMRLMYRQNFGPTNGGEFVWRTSGGGYGLTFSPVGLGAHGVDPDQFISFCVETSENISIPGTYDADLNTESVFTGVPLHEKTAWLYERFIKGALAGYDYAGAGRDDSGAALQAAIWHFQGQGYSGTGPLTATQVALRTAFIAAADSAAPASIGNVRILNIWTFGGDRTEPNKRQDMLVMIPLPAPVWMAGIGLCGVIGLCYRRRSARGLPLEPVEF